MSNHEQPTPSNPKLDVRNTTWKNKQTLQDSVRTTSAVDLEEFCEKHYEKLLPIMADKRALGRRNQRILSLGQYRQEDRDALAARAAILSSKQEDWSTFAHSDSRQESSRYMENHSKSEDSEGGHWKSKSRRKKSSVEDDDLSQPWVLRQNQRQMKEHIAKLPMLTAPEEQEELIVYLAASKEAVSAVVILKERGSQADAIYFVNRALRRPEDSRITGKLGVPILEVNVDSKLVANQGPSQANYVLREIHEGSCSNAMRATIRRLPSLRTVITGPTMHQGRKGTYKSMSGMPSTTNLAGPFRKVPSKSQISNSGYGFYFTKWIEAKPVATITGNQTNGLVERANRSLGEGIKARLGKDNRNWLEEISHVLWAHHTMVKSSNGVTPFSLTYGTKAVIPAEIRMPTRKARASSDKRSKKQEANGKILQHQSQKCKLQAGRLGVPEQRSKPCRRHWKVRT
ncbi:reverse transcriptase domain-containing protein [Tanacetum coccineum]